MNILLIEDNPVEARYLLGLFRNEPDVVMETATSLAKGIARANEMPYPDIALLDLELPDSEFEATLPRFLKECPNVPVFVSTSLENMELARKLGYLGAIGYALKKQGAKHILHLLSCAIGANQRDREMKEERERLRQQLLERLDRLKENTSDSIVENMMPLPDKEDGGIT